MISIKVSLLSQEIISYNVFYLVITKLSIMIIFFKDPILNNNSEKLKYTQAKEYTIALEILDRKLNEDLGRAVGKLFLQLQHIDW